MRVIPAYQPRLRLRVAHGYYADNRARALRCTPDADTADWLRLHDTVVRDSGDGLDLYATTARGPSPPQLLSWVVRSGDPLFANVTAGLPREAGQLLCFLGGTARSDGQPQSLHAAEFAGLADIWPMAVPGTLAAVLSAREQAQPPSFVVRVPAPDLQLDEAPAADWRISFAARAPIWHYRLMGDWSGDALRIEDAAQQAAFTEAQPVTLRNGQSALSIRSLQGIALRERPEHRFQLRSRNALADRVLVKRLPVAAADQFARETIDGVPTLVSEIFVHR